MALDEQLLAATAALPVRLARQKDGTLAGEAVIAERKAFLTRRKLTYKCSLRVDDGSRTVRFHEMLLESGSGPSTGGLDDMTPGFGFKKEVYKVGGKERSGSIEEASRLFGKDYRYQWDYAQVREALRRVTDQEGYTLETVLDPRSV